MEIEAKYFDIKLSCNSYDKFPMFHQKVCYAIAESVLEEQFKSLLSLTKFRGRQLLDHEGLS